MEVVTHIVKYNGQTTGRDKLCRLAQYTCKLIWNYLEKTKNNPNLILKLKNLETSFSSTRKLLRFGKSLDMVQGAIKSSQLPDMVLRITLTLTKISQAYYLLIDHLIWLGKTGLVKTDTKKWSKLSARIWLITLVFNLIRDMYGFLIILKQTSIQRKMSYKENQYDKNHNVAKLLYSSLDFNRPLVIDTVKNIADLPLPLSNLGYLKISPSAQGVLGIISSIAAICTVWNPILKLEPS